jgi:DNA repair protein SbcD/Mre11
VILAHLADLHLGYRAYHRLDKGGVNAREQDVARAFGQAVDRLLELAPDVVLIAGDVFHTVRPSNATIAGAFRQFARLAAGLGGAPIVLIAGNHDSPRAIETGSILRLLAEIPGVLVREDGAGAVRLESLDATVLCLPHNALVARERPPIRPDPAAATNILLLHGTVTGTGLDEKLRFVSEYGGAVVDAAELDAAAWDYVALGHYHITTELAPNMWYAGALERTSTNIWEEATGAKGFLTYDTSTRRATFHPVATRAVIDLPRLSARSPEALPDGRSGTGADPGPAAHDADGAVAGAPGAEAVEGGAVADAGEPNAEPGAGGDEAAERRFRSAAEIDGLIRERIAAIEGGLEGAIVRLVIEDIPRDLFRELDHRQIREFRSRALHFHLDPRRPPARRLVGYGGGAQRRTLEEEVEGFLRRHWRPRQPGVTAERLVELAARYLAEARTLREEPPVGPAQPNGKG